MIRLGLVCKFLNEPIRFYTTTATSLLKMDRPQALKKLSRLSFQNAESLLQALQYCNANRIGHFRVNSRILPLKTHPAAGYRMKELPDYQVIISKFAECGLFAKKHDIRMSFHPDQFVLLSSPDPGVVERSIAELEYQAEVADWIGADVLLIHGGGGYGNKPAALQRLAGNLTRLSAPARAKLALENDDRVFTPADLLPVCESEKLPFVYDVHHHRCLPDGFSEEEVTKKALLTWNREPLFHISSPKWGWDKNPVTPHHDYIDPADFPPCWLPLNITVEVEAKAKEEAIKALLDYLEKQ
ncbi:MAG: UV DNA damage repair endonuclease UvsE [Calditrichia bacterium]